MLSLLFFLSILLTAASGAAALALQSRPALAHRVGCWGQLAGTLAGVVLAILCLASDAPGHLRFDGPVPGLGFTLRFDALAGFFLLLVFGLGALATTFGLPYGFIGHSSSLGTRDFCLGFFLASMAVVVLADDVFTFFAAWESMSVFAFLLLPGEHEKREVREAAYLFLIASQVGTAFILVAFLVLAHHAGSLEFDAFRRAAPLSLPWRSGIFALALIGFGTKAGMIPFHVWLPKAHPVAPSHVSALMSGVMIKTALYGLIRFAFEFLAPLDAFWGLVVLTLGAVSAVLGALFALLEHDLKRMLAYSSVENVGIILMGLGVAIFFAGSGKGDWAAYALLAALFHTLNHAVFKTLLFLAAGSVLAATREASLEHLGGLARRMPATAVCFLVGAWAISGLPPANGFASEWMTYQALWVLASGSAGTHLLGPIAAACLALVGGLAAACFVRAAGVGFLGLPRTEPARRAEEAPRGMIWPMAALAALCLFAGLAPGLPLAMLAGCLPRQLSAPSLLLAGPLGLPAARSVEPPLYPLAIVATLAALLLGLTFVRRRLGTASAATRVHGPWNCGYPIVAPRAQYSASGFSQPFAYFARKLLSRKKLLDVHARHHYSPYLPESLVLRVHSVSPFDTLVYQPVKRFVIRLSKRVSRLQTGSLRLYLAFLLGTVILLLLIQP
ncbi:MAG: hydrogenase 4 subunit B [Candidatus Wallbacteria bacterium]|nr:hydrogenase 4 subunit B [Candidatus Wallbacteria bacterium]